MVITIVLLCTMVTLFSFVTATTAMLYAVFLKMRKTMKKIACWRKYDFYESKIPSPIHPVPSFKKFVCITLEVMHHKQRHMLSIVFTLVKLIYLCIPCPIQRNKNDEKNAQQKQNEVSKIN